MQTTHSSQSGSQSPFTSWRGTFKYFNRSLQRIGYGAMVAVIIASLILPLLQTRVAFAQDAPTEVPPTEVTPTEVTPTETTPTDVNPAAVLVDTPPMRSTLFNANGSVSYPAQPRWNSAVPLTIEMWASLSQPTNCESLLDNGSPTSYNFSFCDVDAASTRLRFSRGNTGFVESTTTIKNFTWHHIAVSYDGVNATFFIDGVAAGGGPLTAPALGEDLLIFGGNSLVLGFKFQLDEVRIWSVARTQAQIRESMHKEVRSGAGLAATFGSGGVREDLQPIDGSVGVGAGATHYGFLPKDLVAPLAAEPAFDGAVDINGEYSVAEVMPMRLVRSDGNVVADGQPQGGLLETYLLHTATDLFIGLRGVGLFCTNSCPLDPYTVENTSIAIYLDTDYLRPESVQAGQNRILIPMSDLTTAAATMQVGNGSGGFVDCTGGGCPVRGTDWDVKMIEFDGGEFNPDGRSIEIKLSEDFLGSFDEADGFAMGQINTPAPFSDMSYFGPMGSVASQPDSWATLQYGASTISLPQVKIKGTVRNFLAAGQPPLPNQKVQFGATGINNFTTTTDANGAYEFDVRMPFNKSMFLSVTDCPNCKFATAVKSLVGIQPITLGSGASFNGCLTALCELADITLNVKLPPGPVSFNATLNRPVARMIVNTATNKTTSATTVVINGTNLHDETTFFLSPMPVLQGPQFDPSEWILLPAPVVSRGANMQSVTVSLPTLPKLTKSFNSSVNQGEALSMDWRWVVMDNWVRPDWVDKRASSTFKLIQPPYPEIWGLGFENEATGSSFTEFTSVYGNNAYICVGAFGACITHVPDPLYASLFYGIYRGIISQTGGSCVGMATTSSQFASGRLKSTDFDPAVNFPAGFTVRPDADYDHDSTLDLLTGPARPANLWATIRTNHGRQVSSTVWRMSAEQLIDNAQDGFMELQAQRAASSQVVLSMKDPDATSGGHAITPFSVADFDADTRRVKVYDNNRPFLTSSFVDFNFNDDTFKFDGYTNSGGFIFVYPVSEWNSEATFPADIPGMIGNVIFGDAGEASAATMDGSAPTPQNTTQALITTAQGQYGYLPNGTFVNTLPGAAPVPQVGGGMLFPPVLIPENAPNPKITINANTERYFYMASGGETVLGVRASNVTPGIQDQIAVTSTATALTGFAITPQNTSTDLLPQIGMNLGVQERLLFRPWGLDVAGGTAAGFSVLPEQHGILYENGSSAPSEHYMIVDAVDGAAQQSGTRIFGPMEVAAGADQRITVADWPVARSLKVETDADGDGTFEKVEMFGGRSCGSDDVDDNGVPDACQTGQNVYMPVIAR